MHEQKVEELKVPDWPLCNGETARVVSIVPATGWYACYKIEGEWCFEPLPVFVTMECRRPNSTEWEMRFFGATEFYGGLERVDATRQFEGYAHVSDFEVPGVELTEKAKARIEIGEKMCGDPARW